MSMKIMLYKNMFKKFQLIGKYEENRHCSIKSRHVLKTNFETKIYLQYK